MAINERCTRELMGESIEPFQANDVGRGGQLTNMEDQLLVGNGGFGHEEDDLRGGRLGRWRRSQSRARRRSSSGRGWGRGWRGETGTAFRVARGHNGKGILR